MQIPTSWARVRKALSWRGSPNSRARCDTLGLARGHRTLAVRGRERLGPSRRGARVLSPPQTPGVPGSEPIPARSCRAAERGVPCASAPLRNVLPGNGPDSGSRVGRQSRGSPETIDMPSLVTRQKPSSPWDEGVFKPKRESLYQPGDAGWIARGQTAARFKAPKHQAFQGVGPEGSGHKEGGGSQRRDRNLHVPPFRFQPKASPRTELSVPGPGTRSLHSPA